MNLHSPLEVATAIKDLIKDKVVCDIGCGEGKLLFELSKYAKQAIGIEEHDSEANEAREK